MRHIKRTWFWFSFFLSLFELNFSQAQTSSRLGISLPGKLPSKFELDLIFAQTQNRTSTRLFDLELTKANKKVEFSRQIKCDVEYAAPNFEWPALPYKRYDVLPVDFLQVKNYMVNSSTRNKSYSLYYMPSNDEIDIVLPRSQQVLNYFLMLGSSLYVTSKQSGR